MPSKTISIDQNYQENICSLENEAALTLDTVNSIYDRFISEENYNNKMNALEALQNYRYVPSGHVIPSGRYIRYIDTKVHDNMPLKLGGFVTSDNGYSVVFKSSAESGRVVRLNKKHCIMFVYITDAEKVRVAIQ